MIKQKTSSSTFFGSGASFLTTIIACMISVLFLTSPSFSAEITLSWDPNTEPDLSAYRIYYKTDASGTPYDGTGADQGDSGLRVPVQSLVSPDNPVYTLTGLQDGRTYYFVVTAVDSDGYESGYSNEIMYEPNTTAPTYTITSTSGSYGSISPAGTKTLTEGGSQTYTISPDPNYHIQDVQVDGVSVGPVAEYTFSNVNSNHTISASFEVDTFSVPRTITASCGTNGSISPEGLINVVQGSDVTFQITPGANYRIKDVQVDGVSVGATSVYTFSNVTADHSITATFDINTYVITASSGLHGNISPAGPVSVEHGSSQIFTISADPNYSIADVKVDGASVGAVASYTFANVIGDHTVSAFFDLENQAPIVSNIPNQTVTEGAGFAAVNLDDYVSDPDNTDAEIAWSVSGNAQLTVTIDANRVATITTPNANWIGSETIIFTAADPDSLSDSHGVVFTVSGDTVTVEFGDATNSNYPNTVEDTFLRGDDINYSTSVDRLEIYTWPTNVSANSILIKWDLNQLPSNAVVQSSTLYLYMNDNHYGTGGDELYEISSHKILNHNVDVSQCTWNTYDGVNSWTGGANGGQNDIAAAEDFRMVDNTVGYKEWTVTRMVQDWVSDPSHNFGMMLLSDQGANKASSNTNRMFVPTDNADPDKRPKLVITYSIAGTNDAPVVGDIPDQVVEEGGNFAAINLDDYVNDPDNTDAEIAWSVSGNAQLTVTIDANRVATITSPSLNWTGTEIITFTAADQGLLSNSDGAAFTVKAKPLPTFAITSSSGSYGSISPAGTKTLTEGGSQTYTISPDPNYRISDVQVDGASVGAADAYTFSDVTADHTITAAFEINTYVVSAFSGFNGSISPAGSVSVVHGASQTFTITPDAGYRIGQVVVDGAIVAPANSYSFTNVISNHSISVDFIPATYTITATSSDYGSISPAGSVPVQHGSGMAFNLAADPGCTVVDVQVDGVSVGAVTSYAFTDVAGDHSISAVFDLENQTPIADAGPDQHVEPGEVVSLTGANAIDLDDGIASFMWEQVNGSPVDISFDPLEPNTTFVAPEAGPNGESLTFKLTVTDIGGLRSADTCIVNVSSVNVPPVSDAGTDQTVEPETIVTLNGSQSTDPDGTIAAYRWEQISGTPVSLSDPTAIQPRFSTMGAVPDGSTVGFQLTVTDDGGLQSADTCIVNISGTTVPPVSDAGPDQTVTEGTMVTLDGSKSADADDGIVFFLWKQISGIPVRLSDSTATDPTFTAPQGITETESLKFTLNVTDGVGLQSSDSCTVQVTPTVPAPFPSLVISSISIELDAKRRSYKAVAHVSIETDSGSMPDGVSVIGNWAVNGKYLNTASASTTAEGVAVLVSNPVYVKSGDVFSIVIADVVKEGFLYDPTTSVLSESLKIVKRRYR